MLDDGNLRLVDQKKLERTKSLISEMVPWVLQTISCEYNISGLGLTGPLLISRISSMGQNLSHEDNLDYTTPHVDLYSYKVGFNDDVMGTSN